MLANATWAVQAMNVEPTNSRGVSPGSAAAPLPKGKELSQSPFDDEPAPEQESELSLGWRDKFPPADYRQWQKRESGDEAWSYWLLTIVGVTFAGTIYGLPFFIIGAVFGFMIAGCFSAVLAAPFAIAVKSLCGTWRHPIAAPCFGGLIGFVSTSAIWEEVLRFRSGGFGLLLLGPMTTTLLGQAGGYLITRRDHVEMVVRKSLQGEPWRFSIRTVMIATAWLAAVLGLLQCMGMLEEYVLAMIALWLPWQGVLLWGWSRLGRRAAAKAVREGRFT